ncbi:hypothetical protein [Primorskyibacter marinus]|uniref:hypothetical protein n=1 Tax=Primorskyibacter marinus TaxID=1977320 RepID=UPI0013007678|nr:hypothetical protein [Primorskyibacter marinus]
MRKNVVMIAAVISLMVSLQATAEGTEDFPKTAVMTDGSTAGKSAKELQYLVCESWGEVAAITMQARQVGVLLSKALKGAEIGSPIYEVVILAYEKPRFSTERRQNLAISDFRSEMEMGCFKGGLGAVQ